MVTRHKSGKGELHILLKDAAIAALQSLRSDTEASSVPFLNSKGTAMTTHCGWLNPTVKEARVPDYTWQEPS
jgi:hypothetical protein